MTVAVINHQYHQLADCIINRGSTFRGHVREKICVKIAETFGLKLDTSKEAVVKFNAKRVAWLLEAIGDDGEPNRYCYRVRRFLSHHSLLYILVSNSVLLQGLR